MTKKNPISRRRSKAKSSESIKVSDKVYTLDVFLIEGPVIKEFNNKEISRTIQIRGNQTLEDLHHMIFKFFDRWEEHLYEFNMGKGPYDRSAIYTLLKDTMGWGEDEEAGDVAETMIDSLGLKVGRAFGYLFDFGDEWLHQINVAAIGEFAGKGRYPKIIKRVSKSPPQYPDIDEEEI